LAEIEKSTKLSTAVAKRRNVPLFPSMPITNAPAPVLAGMETVIVEVAVPPAVNETVRGFIDTVGPEGEIDVASETTPEKPFRLLSVRVTAVLEGIACKIRDAGLALIVNPSVFIPAM